MDLISVIVPVYKAEKYIDRCIESIVSQTYKRLDIILVDDGSPDNCPVICDMWEEKDSRIRVIHTENGGSARARNLALNEIRGNYVAFCDADDVMHPRMLEVLHSVAVNEKADIVECDFSTNIDDIMDTSNEVSDISCYNAKEALAMNFDDIMFRQVIWNKLYTVSVVSGTWFVEGRTIDDEFWTYNAIAKARKLARIEKKLYFYRQQDDSVMHQPYSSKRLETIEAHIMRHSLIEGEFPELINKSIVHLWFDCRYQGQMSEKYLSPKERQRNMGYLKLVLKKYPMRWSYMAEQSTKEKMWIFLEMVSLPLICKIRNYLNIGF